MNKHIELVKKWLDDPTSVTQQELKDNRDAAGFVLSITSAADKSGNALACDAVAYSASGAAVFSYTDYTKHWVKRYEELTEQGE